MAKFCTKCGKKLVEGKTCDCEKDTNETVETKKEETTSSVDASAMFHDYIEVAKGMFTHPIDTMKKYAKEKNFVLGLIMMAVYAITVGLMIWLAAKRLMELSGIPEEISSMGSVEIVAELIEEGIPTQIAGILGIILRGDISILFKVAIFVIANMAMMAGFIHIIAGPILKAKVDVKQIFTLVGVTSVLGAVATLVAIVCMYISGQLMALVLGIAAMLQCLYLYHGLVATTKIPENKLAYTFVAANAITMFLLFTVVIKIL